MGKTLSLEDVVEKARVIHGKAYKYTKLIKEKGKSIKVECVCPRHGVFVIRASRHYTEGKGCPICSLDTKKKGTDEFIKEASRKYSGKYDYNRVVYTHNKVAVDIICPIHGVFRQTPNQHLRSKYGCKACGIAMRAQSRTKDTEWFIKTAKEVHGNKYSYGKTVYTKGLEHVVITCPVHGDFKQLAVSHTSQAQGCPTCGGLHGKTTEQFIEEAKVLHGDKYDYSKTIYTGALGKVTIICPEHGEFEQIASNHISKSGCPHCSVSGFNKLKPGILYYLEITHMGKKYYKIGITNLTVHQRFSVEDRNKIKVISITEYQKGEDAYNEEQKLLKQYKKYSYIGEDILKSGNTELFIVDVLRETHE